MRRAVAVVVTISMATGCGGVVGKLTGKSAECERIAAHHAWAAEAHGYGVDYWMHMDAMGGWDMDEVSELSWECSNDYPEDWKKGQQRGQQVWQQERYGGYRMLD